MSKSLPLYSLDHQPPGLSEPMRKKTLVSAAFISHPFLVDTQEGIMEISPKTCDDFGEGYYVLYPDDGSKPYTNSEKFFKDNYVLAVAPPEQPSPDAAA